MKESKQTKTQDILRQNKRNLGMDTNEKAKTAACLWVDRWLWFFLICYRGGAAWGARWFRNFCEGEISNPVSKSVAGSGGSKKRSAPLDLKNRAR